MKRGFMMVLALAVLAALANATKPRIRSHPQDTTIVAGDNVLLECVLDSLKPNEMVLWTKGGFALGYDRILPDFPRYSVTGDQSKGEYNLLIKNITIDEEDVYECQVTSHKLRSRSAIVTVQVPSQGPFIDDAVNGVINVRANSINLITCRSTNGKPVADLRWYKDDSPVHKDNVTYGMTDNSAKLFNRSATLRVWPTTDQDRLRYKCVMTSAISYKSQREPTVKELPVTLNVQKPPTAQLNFQPSSTVKEGHDITVICDVSDSKPPVSSYIWFINGKEIKDKSDSKLFISAIGRSKNRDTIGCQAVNQVGRSRMAGEQLNVLYPPQIITSPEEQTVNVSEMAVFKCEWDSNPVPSITWYKGSEVLGHGSILTIKSADQQLSGEIACTAQAGQVGDSTITTSLTVLGPPVFAMPEIQHAQVGNDVAEVICEIGSSPGIDHVEWNWESKGAKFKLADNGTLLVNNAPMLSDENLLDERGNGLKYESRYLEGSSVAKLFIMDVKEEDMIIYNCTIINSYGTRTKTVNLQAISSAIGAGGIILIIAGVTGGVFFVALVIFIAIRCCKYKQAARNSPYNIENLKKRRLEDRMESAQNFASSHQQRNDPDSDNISTSSSMSTPVGNEEAFIATRNDAPSTQNDDGYHTEAEVNSWKANDKASSPTTRNIYNSDQVSPLLPIASSPASTPSSKHSADRLSVKVVQNMKHDRTNSQSELSSYSTQLPSNRIPTNSYASLGRNGAFSPSYYPYPSGTPSVAGSHRSVSVAPPYVSRQYSVENYPSNISESYNYPSSIVSRGEPPMHSSALDPNQSMYSQDAFENSSQISQPMTHISQSSRVSEMFQRPLQARMATHV